MHCQKIAIVIDTCVESEFVERVFRIVSLTVAFIAYDWFICFLKEIKTLFIDEIRKYLTWCECRLKAKFIRDMQC